MKASRSLALSILVMATCAALGQGIAVTGRVVLTGDNANRPEMVQAGSARDSVVWLAPSDGRLAPVEPSPQHFRLTQKDKQFSPHLLIVPVGSSIDFPNRDPFFHNVFSLFDGKRFDLGLYESGSSREVRFDRPGVSFIFCNIHSQMSAVVIAVDTPYYATSRRGGEVTIPSVPPGRYVLHVWNEMAGLDTLKALSRKIDVAGTSSNFGMLTVKVNTASQLNHKNLYGQDYETPDPMNSVYAH